jgi:hypothetical protein
MISSIDALRSAVHGDVSFAQRVEAACLLCSHPECTWDDLLRLLGHPELVAEQAVFRLCRALGTHPTRDMFRASRDEWTKLLLSQGRRLADPAPR